MKKATLNILLGEVLPVNLKNANANEKENLDLAGSLAQTFLRSMSFSVSRETRLISSFISPGNRAVKSPSVLGVNPQSQKCVAFVI